MSEGSTEAEVTSIGANGKHTIDDVARWCDLAAEKGYYPANSARLYKTALQQMASVLSADEPHSPEWVLEHLDELAGRYANKQMPTQATLRTYLGKARTLLSDFVEFKRNPVAFKPRGRASTGTASATKETKKTTKNAPATESTAPPAESPATTPEVSTTAPRARLPIARDYPLGGGRTIHFSLPDDGVTFAEVKKFAMHMLTLATDFDLSDPDQVEVLSLVRRK